MRSTFTSKRERRPPFFFFEMAPPAGTERAEPNISIMVTKDHTRQGEEPPRTATRADHRTRKSSISASIPKRCVQKYVVQSDCMPGHSASSIRSSSSWKAARSQKHLEGVDKGPLGVRHHKGRFHIKALSGCGSSHSSLHSRSGSPHKGRVKRTPDQRSSSRGPRRGFYSNLFLVPKKASGQRPVINLKSLNSFVQTQHFKMEGIHTLRELIEPGDWLAKVDLKDAYFAVPIHYSHHQYLRFNFQGKCYQFICLPFGLSSAPWVFTRP